MDCQLSNIKNINISMYDNYPPGAALDPNAPYNQVEGPEVELTCTTVTTLSKQDIVYTDNYMLEDDEEDGSVHTEVLATYSELEHEYLKQHHSIPELLEMLAEYIKKDLEVISDKERIWELREILKECSGWKLENTEIEDYALA